MNIEDAELHKLKQKTFNKAARHMVKQGVPARNMRGDCAYRAVVQEANAAGKLVAVKRRCGVGVLINDDVYRREFETLSVTKIHEDFGSIFPFSHLCLELLSDIQTLHDTGTVVHRPLGKQAGTIIADAWKDPSTLRRALKLLATKHGLSYSVIARD